MVGERETRPWGSWEVLDEGTAHKVKKIVVEPGQRLSYQTHEHRTEHWTVVAGRATCVIGGDDVVLELGESVRIEKQQPHRICNMDTEVLVIVEVQFGAYCGEDDICRLEDDYGRLESRA